MENDNLTTELLVAKVENNEVTLVVDKQGNIKCIKIWDQWKKEVIELKGDIIDKFGANLGKSDTLDTFNALTEKIADSANATGIYNMTFGNSLNITTLGIGILNEHYTEGEIWSKAIASNTASKLVSIGVFEAGLSSLTSVFAAAGPLGWVLGIATLSVIANRSGDFSNITIDALIDTASLSVNEFLNKEWKQKVEIGSEATVYLRGTADNTMMSGKISDISKVIDKKLLKTENMQWLVAEFDDPRNYVKFSPNSKKTEIFATNLEATKLNNLVSQYFKNFSNRVEGNERIDIIIKSESNPYSVWDTTSYTPSFRVYRLDTIKAIAEIRGFDLNTDSDWENFLAVNNKLAEQGRFDISTEKEFVILGLNEASVPESYEALPEDLLFPFTGNDNDNTIYGTHKSNTLKGNGGNDTIYGWGQDKNEYGNEDKGDTIYGGSGSDTIYGGLGENTIL